MKLPIPEPYPLTSNEAPASYNLEEVIEILSRVTGRPFEERQLGSLVSTVGATFAAIGRPLAVNGIIKLPLPPKPNRLTDTILSRDDFQKIIDYCLDNPGQTGKAFFGGEIDENNTDTMVRKVPPPAQRSSTAKLRALMEATKKNGEYSEFLSIWESGKHGYGESQKATCRKAYNRYKNKMSQN